MSYRICFGSVINSRFGISGLLYFFIISIENKSLLEITTEQFYVELQQF